MKRYIVSIMLIAVALTAVPAHANQFCSGTVTFVGVGTAGDVVVQGPGGLPAIFFCNMNNSVTNGFTPEACKAAYATLLAAKLSGQQVQVSLTDNLTCSTEPAWTAYAPVNFIATF